MDARKHGISAWIMLGVAILAGLAVFVLLVPTSGAADRCYSLLAFQVPCEGQVALAMAAATAALTGLALWLRGRRRTA